MKKTLLSLAVSLLAGGMALSAQSAEFEQIKAPVKAESSASRGATDDGFQLRFSGDVENWTSATSSSNITYNCYIYIEPEIATQLAGNKITDVTFSAAIQSVAAGLEGGAFVSEDINADPVAFQSAKITNGLGEVAKMQTITFDEPYVIKENTGFFFGYKVEKCRAGKDYPVALDGNAATSYAGYVKLVSSLNGADRGTVDIGKQIGYNMVLYATTVGEKHEVNNLFSVGDVSFGKFTMPVMSVADCLNINVPIANFGTNDITSVVYSSVANGGEAVESTAEVNVPGETFTNLELPIPGVGTGENTVEFNLISINGVSMPLKVKTSFVGVNSNYERKFVVEEGTGTWCGWCPRGIVGLETMAEKYPEKFIGIAVHSGDAMEVSSYSPLLSKYFTGFPSCIVNRDKNYSIDPSYAALEEAYNMWASQGALAGIELQVEKGNAAGTLLKVSTTTTFGLSATKAKYAIAFVVLEDGLTGNQSNYYAGGGNGEMGGWESKPSTVNWTYKDTARGIYTCWGIKSSVPATIEEGVPYDYTYNLMLTNIKNIDETSVVALLLDTSNNVIVNAAKVKAADYADYNGIADITVDEDAPAEYYNLQGIRMPGDNLPAGVYVVRQGNSVKKIVK